MPPKITPVFILMPLRDQAERIIQDLERKEYNEILFVPEKILGIEKTEDKIIAIVDSREDTCTIVIPFNSLVITHRALFERGQSPSNRDLLTLVENNVVLECHGFTERFYYRVSSSIGFVINVYPLT